MIRFFFFFTLIGAAIAGFWLGKEKGEGSKKNPFVSEKKFPLTEHKSFVFIVYGYNQANWCERALRSIFEQETDYYRVIFIDDGSVDGTFEKAQSYILDHNQDHRVILMRNETQVGPIACLYRVIDSCLDREIAIPIDAKNWLAHPKVLSHLNAVYQNPNLWLTFGQAIRYPSYEILDPMANDAPCSFYSGIFKQIQLSDLFQSGHFTFDKQAYLNPLLKMAGGRFEHLIEPLAFLNDATNGKREPESLPPAKSYEPLAEFPKPRIQNEKADLLLFSFDRPLQLYSCLESIQRYMSGFEKITVLLRASNEEYRVAYAKVKETFPNVNFVVQNPNDPKHDFKPKVNQIVFNSPSKYIVFGVDDIIVKDFVDINTCVDWMEKTKAYGFYLRFGRHINYCYQNQKPQETPPSFSLSSGVYAWDIETGKDDWRCANSVDMTLFEKGRLKEAFEKIKFKTPNSLEFNWSNEFFPKGALGLYFEQSKIVNVPLNVMGKTGNPHMNYLNADELLAKFNQGLKINIEPFHQIENPSPHHEQVPDFVVR